MKTKTSLSKSQFMKGVQCHKALWLYKYNRELRTPHDHFRQAIFDMGKEVGMCARGLFPDGKEITYEEGTFAQKIKQTQRYIGNGEHTIYEATFSYDDTIVMVDILHKGDNGWELYEVKGSASAKEEYLNDISIQYYVLSGCGLPVSKTYLVHLNNEYVRRGEINVSELFTVLDYTQNVIENQEFVLDELSKMQAMLKRQCPDIDIGPHCISPYECDFSDFCWQHIPENSIFNLKEKGINKFDYYYKGIIKFRDLDVDVLNFKQRMQVEAELYDRDTIDTKGIKEFLDKLYYPQYFLDFETFAPPIPLYKGTHPYQSIPFQYSLHVLESENSELTHHEYLAEAGVDAREKIARDLSALIPDNACVITYNSSFEKAMIRELTEMFPAYKDHLLKINDNIVDLMVPFRRRHYYTKEMKGSYSMKYVLPAVIPELGYDGMNISDGGNASHTYSSLHLIEDENEAEKIRNDLLEYCRLDTLGMVKIVEKIKETYYQSLRAEIRKRRRS